MPLTTDDVQRILTTAITQANLAPTEEIITSIATTLANAITPSLNALVGSQTGLITTQSATAPVMAITEALAVRDVVESVIAVFVSDVTASNDAAEELLNTGYIDVPSILASVRNPAAPVVSTGSVKAVTASSPVPVSALSAAEVAAVSAGGGSVAAS